MDSLRHTYDGMGSFLKEVGAALAEAYPNWAYRNPHACVFFPQLGFLTVVDVGLLKEAGSPQPCAIPPDSWEERFADKNRIYYKNKYMRELDEEFGDIYSTIVGMSL